MDNYPQNCVQRCLCTGMCELGVRKVKNASFIPRKIEGKTPDTNQRKTLRISSFQSLL